MAEKNLEYYLSLPYTIEVIPEHNEEGYFARVVELPGCMTQADDFTELEEMIEDAKMAWLETALEEGIPIPEPRPSEEYSGKFVVRVPKSLHHDLAEAAEKEGVSLNTYVNVVLGRGMGGVQVHQRSSEKQLPNLPRPIWPQLRQPAWRALIAAGYEIDAEQINEQLFANWMKNHIQQIEAALDIGSLHDTINHLDQCQQAMHICCQNSPILQVFEMTLVLLEKQIREVFELQRGIIHQNILHNKLKAQLQARSSPVSQVFQERINLEYPLYSEQESEAYE